ncbi:MAG: hypothetical protein H8E05_01355 [Bacteroidetes bacterium]|nr:hypothetical protein [Bacteroidota bacterium]
MSEELNEDSSGDLQEICFSLNIAKKGKLETEVVWSAIRFAGENPDWPIEDVMRAALDDWDL